MSYDYDIGENYAVIGMRLYCQAAKGSHPRYQWFRNKMLLYNQDSYYIVDQLPERSILLLPVGLSSAGTYHCEVSDSFDNTTVIRSKKLYIDREGTVSPSVPLLLQLNEKNLNSDSSGFALCLPPAVMNRVPLLVQVVVFGSFTFLVLLVSFCCWAGVLISECRCCLCWVLQHNQHQTIATIVFVFSWLCEKRLIFLIRCRNKK